MNKTYKLIEKYPSLPHNWEVNMTVGIGDYPSLGYAPTSGKYYQKYLKNTEVEDNPKFWEPVIEYPVGTKVIDKNPETKGYIYEKLPNGKWKIGSQDYFTISDDSIGENKRFKVVEEPKVDYEILSFSDKDCDIIRWKNKYGFFPHSDQKDDENRCNEFTKEQLLNDSWYIIHSVKDLLTGNIYTIGDTVTYSKPMQNFWKESPKIKIKGFKIWEFNNTMTIIPDDYRYKEGNERPFYQIQPVKEKLFTTEDRVDIYQGDKFYHVDTRWDVGEGLAGIGFKKLKNYKEFSSKQKAEEYIYKNKPKFSFKDIETAFEKIESVGISPNLACLINSLENIVYNGK